MRVLSRARCGRRRGFDCAARFLSLEPDGRPGARLGGARAFSCCPRAPRAKIRTASRAGGPVPPAHRKRLPLPDRTPLSSRGPGIPSPEALPVTCPFTLPNACLKKAPGGVDAFRPPRICSPDKKIVAGRRRHGGIPAEQLFLRSPQYACRHSRQALFAGETI